MLSTSHADKYKLFFHEDELIVNHIEGHGRWFVELSNGLNVYQDDFRQYSEFNDERSYSTWTRLRSYCYSEGIDISKFCLQFRTNRHFLHENSDGYFFCKAILGQFGITENYHYYMAGVLNNGKLIVEQWKMPELTLAETRERLSQEDDICLILNSKMRKR